MAGIVSLLAGGAAIAAAPGRQPALSPDEALQAFRLEPGLRIEIVAAEPLVVDPVAFAFDEERRLFVVENRGYPGAVKADQTKADAPATAEGRIALLEDRDGDGRYERRTEFAGGLTYPNGILPWRGGVFVTCAPEILYLKDNDGDGIADERRVVLTGFSTARTTQIRVSHPLLGLDGKVYVTSGLNGGKVTSPLHPERPEVSFSPADGRFDPETLAFEVIGGRAQFGHSFDAYGRRFLCSNRHPIVHAVLEPGQLKRNPHLAFAETMQNVSRVEAEAVVWPISGASVTADFIPALMSKPHTGTFTSACGVWVLGGQGLGADHAGNVFICEPAQNLVQRQVLRPDGATFRAEPATAGREFLASTDPWFRPVFLGDGPDGALYVADMYRREIDHPQYVPEESRGKLDFLSGKDRGRLYRVRRDGPRPAARAMTRTPAEWVRDLDGPDAWWRERAQRLLVERRDRSVVGALEQVAEAGRWPEGRVRAAWTLAGLGELPATLVRKLARDAVPAVREQAVVLAARTGWSGSTAAEVFLEAAGDSDPRVRFGAALALGSWSDARAVDALAGIAARPEADRWTRVAVLSGIDGRLDAFQESWERRQALAAGEAGAAMAEEWGRVLGAGATLDQCRRYLGRALAGEATAAWPLPAVLGLAAGLQGRAELRAQAGGSALGKLAAGGAAELAAGLERLLEHARTVAIDERADLPRRTRAVALLGQADFARGVAGLGPLLAAREAPELQLQVVRAIDRAGDPKGAEMLVQAQRWSGYTPAVREAVMAALTSKPAMTKVLLAAIDRGDVKAPEVSSVRRTQLLKHANTEVRTAAAKVFQSLEGGDRMAVYRSYREVLDKPANSALGEGAFTRTCSACHTFKGVGGKVGPDLSGVRNQPADALLLHILVPNYEVVPAYQAVTVTTQDGRSVSGWLTAETEGSVTLRTAAGTDETVLRQVVTSLTASGVSLMPDGLEQAMTKEELSGLIAYLKSGAAGQ
ncbi:MAG: c-type cytochrome [Verrucomicrobia bacterium]|nr:c-type cytochrome [Verrucomicrobiota bacterium]